uniref:Uncharacterized protein n=1 Tax=viral metagenome TaxID=1070528 RepID=A0A6C0DI21_9ZZZZ
MNNNEGYSGNSENENPVRKQKIRPTFLIKPDLVEAIDQYYKSKYTRRNKKKTSLQNPIDINDNIDELSDALKYYINVVTPTNQSHRNNSPAEIIRVIGDRIDELKTAEEERTARIKTFDPRSVITTPYRLPPSILTVSNPNATGSIFNPFPSQKISTKIQGGRRKSKKVRSKRRRYTVRK